MTCSAPPKLQFRSRRSRQIKKNIPRSRGGICTVHGFSSSEIDTVFENNEQLLPSLSLYDYYVGYILLHPLFSY